MKKEKNLLYIYDLPKVEYNSVRTSMMTSIKLNEEFKKYTENELPEILLLKSNPKKNFYIAIVNIHDNEKFRDIA